MRAVYNFIAKIVNWIENTVRKLYCSLVKRKNGLFYIGGADTLPMPLTKEEEQAALDNIDDPEIKKLLIEHNLRLVVYIAKKFENTGVGIEDLISIGTIGLIKAINTFCPDKNIKLATYSSRCVENEILMYIRKNSSHQGDCSLDEPLSVDWDGNELHLSDILGTDDDVVARDYENEEERMTVRKAVLLLPERERLIIDLRFGLTSGRELTQKQVADMLGISQSYISRLEKKILNDLKEALAPVI